MQSKLFATALGAFGLGALVSWAITADIHEKRLVQERAGYDELLADKTEHIFALKRILDRPVPVTITEMTPLSIEIHPGPNAFGETIQVVDEPEEDEDSVVPEGETPEETRTNLQALVDAYTADPAVQEDFVEIATNMQEYDKTPPFVLSREAYAYDEEGEHYEKITLTYYMRDRVLLDDEEDPIDEIAGMIGWRNLSQFGGESGDPNVVFVRNRRLLTDFEVVKEDEKELPLHVKYGMEKEQFRVNRAAGLIKLRREDE